LGVTNLNYWMEKPLINKLNIMIKRCEQQNPKQDAVIIVEGSEGEGKTTLASLIGYYAKYKTGRTINIFFRLENLINFSKNTESQIIIWDEPALDALSTDSLNKINKNLIRLLMAVRKKRHFFIFNFTKFYKFSEYIVVDRSLGLIHVYSRKEVQMGHYVYIRRRNLERLYNSWRNSKKRLYKVLCRKRFGGHTGTFRDIFDNGLFDKMDITVNGVPHSTTKTYDLEKDKAISSIGEEEKKKVDKKDVELTNIKIILSKLTLPINFKEELAKQLGISSRTLERWKYLVEKDKKEPETLGKKGFEGDDDNHI